MTKLLAPPFVSLEDAHASLREKHFVALAPSQLTRLIEAPLQQLQALETSWEELPPDKYLRDGGRYRRRRHSCFVVDANSCALVTHRAHWQPVAYNALHGGIERWFEPVSDAVLHALAWKRLLVSLGAFCSAQRTQQPWFVEAHQFRIDTTDGIGRPTPEGAHRDGVTFVAVLLVGRKNIKGGETRVFEADGPHGLRFTMTEPWTMLLLDDEQVIHETTPIQPTDANGFRDTLVLTYREGNFQGPAV